MRQAVLRDSLMLMWSLWGVVVELPDVAKGISPYNSTETSTAWAYAGLVLFVLELVTMLTNSKRRAIHDFIAGSVVVRIAETRKE